jgi:hypothetical protein
MSDQTQSPPSPKPPTWQGWKVRHGRWAWALSPEWASEWIVYWSRNWDVVKVLELAGKFALVFSIVIGVWTYFAEADDREKARQDAVKAKHYRAWELIYTARGSAGDGGRRDALRDLLDDGISLAGVPLSKAYLPGLKLPGAILSNADLTEANLTEANLTRATMFRATLSGATLSGATLSDAYLTNADLTRADLINANLTRANLTHADLTRAVLADAVLTNATLSGADLTRATLSGADLTGATLTPT